MAHRLWARLTWSKVLFGLLSLNTFWSLSFFLAPFTIPPGSFAYRMGGANQMDHWDLWRTFWIYPQAVYAFGDIQCHQMWTRSLWLNGNQMPMCARMISMYLFANFGLVAAALAPRSTSTGQVMLGALPERLRRRLARLGPDRGSALLVVLGLLPIAVDGFTQLLTPYESTNATRILTGLPGGFVGGLLVGAMLVSLKQFGLELRALRARVETDVSKVR